MYVKFSVAYVQSYQFLTVLLCSLQEYGMLNCQTPPDPRDDLEMNVCAGVCGVCVLQYYY